jgi:hypothetical protein
MASISRSMLRGVGFAAFEGIGERGRRLVHEVLVQLRSPAELVREPLGGHLHVLRQPRRP